MRLNKAILLALIFLIVFPQPVLAIDEAVDDYENEVKIASKYQIVRNSTLNAMELKWGLTDKKKKNEVSYYESGYFYTLNMLNGSNNSIISILLNTTIPKKCSIIVAFSQDNLTWVNNVNKSGSYKIKSGFQTVDLRDLSFNIIYLRFTLKSGGKKDFTPRIYQLRLIYQDQDAPVEAIPLSSMSKYYAVAIILLMLGIIMGKGIHSNLIKS